MFPAYIFNNQQKSKSQNHLEQNKERLKDITLFAINYPWLSFGDLKANTFLQQQFDLNQQGKMLIEGLVQKISNSMQQLARILDQIYKMPVKSREKYFDSIQKLKDRLVILKTQAKQSNFAATEKTYKQIYFNLHKLKEEIGQQITLVHNKENRDCNRPSIREVRKDHEDAMKLIVDKDQKIEQLNQALFEKEELVKVTFEELRRYKKEAQQMTEQYKLTKNALSKLQIEYSSLRSVFIKTEESNIDFQLKDQGRQRGFRQVIEELQSLKQELIAAHHKIQYFQELAEVSIRKTKQVQENIRMVEIEASTLNQNYRRQEGENLRKMKEIDDLSLELNEKNSKVIEQEIEIDKLRQEVQILEFELQKLQKFMYEERAINYQERNRKQSEVNRFQELIQQHRVQQEALQAKNDLLQSNLDESHKSLQEKSKELRRLTEQLEQQRVKVEQYLMMTLNMQKKQEETDAQIALLQRQKQMQQEQLEKALQLSKELQNDIKTWKQKLKIKEQQKIKVVLQSQKHQRQLKSLEKERQAQSRHVQSFQKELIQSKTNSIRLQQAIRQKDKQMESLRVRLLRAKIEIIHEIRQQIS